MNHHTSRRTIAIVALLVLALAVGPAVTAVAAQDDDKVTVDKKCEGGMFDLDKKVCQFQKSVLGTILNIITDFVGGIIKFFIDLILGAPVPTHNGGEPAIVQPPDNQPWKAVYESWKSWAVPLGLLEWLLMVIGVMFSQVIVSSQETQLQLREMKHRVWKVLFGIVGSWAIGAIILHVANAITLTVAPTAADVSNNLAVLIGQGQAVSIGAVLMYIFGATIFIFVLLMILVRTAVVFIFMWGLPVLLPLAAMNVGPLEIISRPARGLIDMFIPFAFMTLPMALCLKVGFVVVNGLNTNLVASAGMWLTNMNGMIILGFWIIAAVSPLFVFQKTGRIVGLAAVMAGASISRDVGDTVQQAKQNTGYDLDQSYYGPFPHSPENDFGGDIPDGGDQPSMLTGGSGQPSALNQSDDLTLSGGGGTTTGAGGGASAGTGTASNQGPSVENVTQVDHPRDLPSGTKFNVGRVNDNGNFQPIQNDPTFTQSGVVNNCNAVNTSDHYQDEQLFLQSQEDGSYLNVDSMSYREQSYDQMSRDTSDDVLNS